MGKPSSALSSASAVQNGYRMSSSDTFVPVPYKNPPSFMLELYSLELRMQESPGLQ